jgi:hypothetical protein
MADRPEDRARRVENVLESGDVGGAMKALEKEMQSLSPSERGAVLRSLQQQNDAANAKDWTLPNVEIKQSTKWLGLRSVEGSYDVSMSHGAIEQAARKINGANPFRTAGIAMDNAGK